MAIPALHASGAWGCAPDRAHHWRVSAAASLRIRNSDDDPASRRSGAAVQSRIGNQPDSAGGLVRFGDARRRGLLARTPAGGARNPARFASHARFLPPSAVAALHVLPTARHG